MSGGRGRGGEGHRFRSSASGRSFVRLFLSLSTTALVWGCAAVGDVAPEAAGLGAGAGAGVVTANPLVGVAVAIGARFAVAEGVERVRSVQRRRVQRAIAGVAGGGLVETILPWSTEPDFLLDTFFGTVDGHVQVVREFGGRIRCREIMYTQAGRHGGVEGTAEQVETDLVDDDGTSETGPAGWPEAGPDPVLVAVICRDGHGWRWAVSQPASDANR